MICRWSESGATPGLSASGRHVRDSAAYHIARPAPSAWRVTEYLMAHKLDRLLRPKTIAVFGGLQAAEVIKQSQKMGFSGEIWPVHPKHDEIYGLKVYRSVADLPAGP